MKNIKELSTEIFESAMEYLPRLLDGLYRASVHFKNNECLEGYAILHDANEGLMWFNEVVQGLPVLLPQEEDTNNITTNWQRYINALNSMLPLIEKRDASALSKTLEDEIIPFIKIFYEKISNLKQRTEYLQ
ncbi:hypothetical protein L7E55_12430 [Pelotomaculum isophthalicicum JI]|uniref:DUF8042 domain-containing protein n=1 Tax=Pelotomaculum isophthalicicum JI TaxID=947010 RepID=A0A9X4H6B9_9FIRM|nr:hypothetical protein [Pelotomaculum isophthalicicum]MDF9409152.1 hypothetical protein [Pelotomaculum isophthalicicum JI]